MRFIAPVVVLTILVGCSSESASEDPSTAENVGSVSSAVCGTADASWTDFPAGNGTQQCVTGVRIFYQNKFAAFVPPASGGPVGNCAQYGACNIWVNPANRPSAAKWNRYAWGGSVQPQKYDMVVFEASSAHPYGHIASVDHYSGGKLWVMDSNYSPWTGRKAACVHDTAGHTPYGFYRLKSLEPAAPPPAPPVTPTACHSSAGGFSFACDGAVAGETCVKISDTADTAWKDDYFCSEDDIGMKWSESGPIAGMTCTNITQNGASAAIATAWKDNFLCLPTGSQYTFTWSEKGPIAGQSCTRWNESTDTAAAALDNYLCVDIQDAVTPPEGGDDNDSPTSTVTDPTPVATPAATADAPAAAADSSGCSAAPGRGGSAGMLAFALGAIAAIAARRRSR